MERMEISIEMGRTRVYVAGPYTKGDVALNVREAVRVSDELLKLGYAPYCPHLTHFWHMLFPHKYQAWLDLDNEWVTCCDALLRIPGESSGADKEVALAESLGIPVFFSIEEFTEAVPAERLPGGVPDPEVQQAEACWPRAGQDSVRPAGGGSSASATPFWERSASKGASITPADSTCGAFQYNAELPKGVPAEVTVEAAGTPKPKEETPVRPLKYGATESE